MRKKCLSALILAAVLFAVILPSLAEGMAFETMLRPPETAAWISLGQDSDVYLARTGSKSTPVRSQKKSGSKLMYSWKQFVIRALDYDPAAAWHRVALPMGDGFVKTGQTAVAGAESRPRMRAYVDTATQGYVWVAAAGELPLVVSLQANNKTHQLLLPLNEQWQPVLLTLGAGAYTLSVYEAGLNDWPIRKLFETAFTLQTEIPDTQLALFSSLHTNMDDHKATIALARELCKDDDTDLKKVTHLWNWLMRHASYDKAYAKGIQFSKIPDGDAFTRGEKGICSDYAAFLAAGLRAVGVPVKHIYGKNLRTGNQHAWNEVYLDGKWQIIDATMAQSRGPKKFHTEDPKLYGVEKGLWDGYH